MRKDGIIDMMEWTQTFNNINDGAKVSTLVPTPLALLNWEESLEYQKVQLAVGRNRKLLLEKFAEVSDGKKLIPFKAASEALGAVLDAFKLTDEKMQILLRVAEKSGGVYDHKQLLDVFKERNQTANLFPHQS